MPIGTVDFRCELEANWTWYLIRRLPTGDKGGSLVSFYLGEKIPYFKLIGGMMYARLLAWVMTLTVMFMSWKAYAMVPNNLFGAMSILIPVALISLTFGIIKTDMPEFWDLMISTIRCRGQKSS